MPSLHFPHSTHLTSHASPLLEKFVQSVCCPYQPLIPVQRYAPYHPYHEPWVLPRSHRGGFVEGLFGSQNVFHYKILTCLLAKEPRQTQGRAVKTSGEERKETQRLLRQVSGFAAGTPGPAHSCPLIHHSSSGTNNLLTIIQPPLPHSVPPGKDNAKWNAKYSCRPYR